MPWGLTPKDLESVPADLVAKRIDFARRYCAERGWPSDPGRLTSKQLFEMLDHPEWPR